MIRILCPLLLFFITNAMIIQVLVSTQNNESISIILMLEKNLYQKINIRE